jgi:transcriptional regulator with XRE-family HTH domain
VAEEVAEEVAEDDAVSGQRSLQVQLLAADQMIRSARRLARLSQREVADRAGVPRSTIGRIESRETRDPSMRVVQKLLAAAGHYLVAMDRLGNPLGEHPHDNKIDRGGRYFPAHLDLEEVNDPFDAFSRVRWWGWWRIAWWPEDPAVPRWTFVRIRTANWNPPLMESRGTESR